MASKTWVSEILFPLMLPSPLPLLQLEEEIKNGDSENVVSWHDRLKDVSYMSAREDNLEIRIVLRREKP
jgi:hypothetical protein